MSEQQQVVTPPSEPKKLSKKEKELQRKEEERLHKLNQESTAVFNRLSNKFFDFFLDHPEPDGPEVLSKIKEVSAQWKIFCRRHNIVPQFYNNMENHCTYIVEDYRNERDGKPKIIVANEQQQAPESKAMDQGGDSAPAEPESPVPGDAVVQGSGDAQRPGAENS